MFYVPDTQFKDPTYISRWMPGGYPGAPYPRGMEYLYTKKTKITLSGHDYIFPVTHPTVGAAMRCDSVVHANLDG